MGIVFVLKLVAAYPVHQFGDVFQTLLVIVVTVFSLEAGLVKDVFQEH